MPLTRAEVIGDHLGGKIDVGGTPKAPLILRENGETIMWLPDSEVVTIEAPNNTPHPVSTDPD